MNLRRTVRRAYSRIYGPYDYSSHIIALHDYRAIFMAVPKVANTSIKSALTELMPNEVQELSRAGHKARSVYSKHRDDLFRRNVRLYKHQVRRHSDYLVFAFVRNPWDRLVSCYRDKIEWGAVVEDGKHQDPRSRRLYLGRQFERNMTFGQFVYRTSHLPDKRANRHIRSQHTFLTDRNGGLLPSYIGRFEHLTRDFSEVMERLGRPDVSLPHVRRSESSDYRSYYTEELVDVVARRYRRDIELFGFTFNEAI